MTAYPKAGYKRICMVASTPLSIRLFMKSHIDKLREDCDVTITTSGPAEELAELLREGVSFRSLPIERKISIKKDCIALFQLWQFFRKKKFDSVHSITPKAGFLSMLAARLAGVPFRIHTFTGQVWATKRGVYRVILKFMDMLLARNATHLLADSHSQRAFLIKNKVVKAEAIDVLAEGSIAGVNMERFKSNPETRRQIRLRHQIQSGAVVFLYLGRLNQDKGIDDLTHAFQIAAAQNINIHLLIVGPNEVGLDFDIPMLEQQFPKRVSKVGYTDRPEDYLSASDVLCLPSYREGFPNTPLQAAAVGLPTIGSRIYGIVDAVEDGVTGILHKVGSRSEIADAMLNLASNENLRRRMGEAGRKRVIDKFSEKRVTKAFVDFYKNILLDSNNNAKAYL